MKIDSKKLAKLIKQSLENISDPYCVASGVTIGETAGAQIQIKITRDEDDHSEMMKAHQCITL